MTFFSSKPSIPKEGTDSDEACTCITNERKAILIDEKLVAFPTTTRLTSSDDKESSLILQPSIPYIQRNGNTSSRPTEPTYVLAPPVDDHHGENSKTLQGILEATSTQEVFQLLPDVPCPAGGEPKDESRLQDPTQESTLSESDIADIDNLIGILNVPRSLFNPSSDSIASLGQSIDFNSKSQSQRDSSSGEFAVGVTSHAFEIFEAIGQMQLEQSLGSRPGQAKGQDSHAGDEPSAVTPFSLGLLFVLPSIFGLLCSVGRVVSSLTNRFPVSELVVTHGVAHHHVLRNQAESDVFAGAIALSDAYVVDHPVFTDKVPFVDDNFFTDKVPFVDDPMLAVEIAPFAPPDPLTITPAVSNPNVLSTSLQIVHIANGTSSTDTIAVNLTVVIVLMAIAVAYILMPRRFANTQRRFEELSVPQLHVEFQKR